MKRFSGRNLLILIMSGVIVFSVALFSLCFLFDNKYTVKGPQAENGILSLETGALSENPVIFLTQGWEIYRGALLKPSDFSTLRNPDEIIYIGQYGGFEGSGPGGSPHGSATYRMNITIPSEPAAYMLELPEIYSAYTLYINGVKAESFGNPDPDSYFPRTGNSSVSFLAQNRVEIIIAVSDFSHMYSGMVYPPAFGVPQAVSAMIQTRLTIRAAVCAVSIALGIFFLTTGALMKNNRAMLLFGAVCLCFTGYICYPVVKTIFRSGMGWYGFENFCFCLMLLLVMFLQRTVSGDKSKLSGNFIGVGILVCALSVFRAALPTGNLRLMGAYSLLISLYKWAAAFFLTMSVVRTIKKNERQSSIAILCGVLIFDCALIMDRLLPMYEPILFGWFLEIGGFFIVLSLGVVMGREALVMYREKLALEGKIAGIQSLVEMQREYYPIILESVEEARQARHDLRHHVNVIKGLISSGNREELDAYFNDYASGITGMTPLTYCENDIVDVILRHFAAIAAHEGVRFDADVAVPDSLPVENADICIILSNLLENALEANAYVAEDRYIDVRLRLIGRELVILVDNSFDGNVSSRGGVFYSRKRRNREGVGLASVRVVAEKYGGGAEFTPDIANKVFHNEVLLHLMQQ